MLNHVFACSSPECQCQVYKKELEKLQSKVEGMAEYLKEGLEQGEFERLFPNVNLNVQQEEHYKVKLQSIGNELCREVFEQISYER